MNRSSDVNSAQFLFASPPSSSDRSNQFALVAFIHKNAQSVGFRSPSHLFCVCITAFPVEYQSWFSAIQSNSLRVLYLFILQNSPNCITSVVAVKPLFSLLQDPAMTITTNSNFNFVTRMLLYNAY